MIRPGLETDQLPTVSVVIPAYNAAATIERALDSVYAQTGDTIIEVIVVDDGSKDSTTEIIQKKYPGVHLIEQENAGPATARNSGANVASGDYIAFLDADDEWLPEKTRSQVGVLKRHPGISMLLCHAETVGNPVGEHVARAGAPPRSATRRVKYLPFHDLFLIPSSLRMCCSAMICSRRALERAGGFEADVRRSEDWELLLRLSGLGYSVALWPETLYRHYWLEDSLSHQAGAARDSRQDEVLRRYDPAGTGWQAELLNEDQYRRGIYIVNWRQGWALRGLGDYAEARASFECAARYAPPQLRTRFWTQAAVHVPRFCDFAVATAKLLRRWRVRPD